jgi:hypothetical protein
VPATLQVESVRYGAALADFLWTNIRTLTEHGFGTKTRHGQDLERIEELIGHNGGIDRRDLLRRSRLRLDELEPLVRTLEESGVVTHRQEQRSGKATVVYFRPTAESKVSE